MNIVKLLNDPLFNSIFAGVVTFFVIKFSNMGNPVLGTLLLIFPMGLFSLYAINKKELPKYIHSTVFTNLIMLIMWSSVYLLFNYFTKNINQLVLIGLSIWIVLGLLLIYIFDKFKSKNL